MRPKRKVTKRRFAHINGYRRFALCVVQIINVSEKRKKNEKLQIVGMKILIMRLSEFKSYKSSECRYIKKIRVSFECNFFYICL